MRVLAAFAAFKDTLDAVACGQAVMRALATAKPEWTVNNLPVSDGGEGFLNALIGPLGLEVVNVPVVGPRGEITSASYGLSPTAAVVEMARASGLEMVAPEHRNPWFTTTYGTGQLIANAVSRGASRIIVGLGGSATNDGGLGALQALGCAITLRDGTTLGEPCCGRHLCEIDALSGRPITDNVEVEIACDVNNPFVGTDGAVAIFSRQKGATTEELRASLELGMVNAAAILERAFGVDVRSQVGAGAAGGLAGGLLAGCNARARRGIEFIGEAIGLELAIQQADVIVTGEGSYDAQTSRGKAISLIKELAAKHQVPVVVICGKTDQTQADENVYPLVARFPLDMCLQETARCIEETVLQTADTWPGGKRNCN